MCMCRVEVKGAKKVFDDERMNEHAGEKEEMDGKTSIDRPIGRAEPDQKITSGGNSFSARPPDSTAAASYVAASDTDTAHTTD